MIAGTDSVLAESTRIRDALLGLCLSGGLGTRRELKHRRLLTNREGLATGVSYVSKDDMQEYQVYGRTVILAASACESARLMLNSKSQRYPNGIGNSS